MKYTNIGSISHGTMRTEDLIPTFEAELEYHKRRDLLDNLRAEIMPPGEDTAYQDWLESEESTEYLDGLFEALDEISPPYFYFGAHPGDGSDYGWWLSEDAIDATFEGLKVDDLSEVPDDYQGEVLHVNDHGNTSLYVADGKGNLEELWAIVYP